MLDTQMNAAAFAKKLRARQAALKIQHKRDLAKYAQDFEVWKAALARFLTHDARKNVERIFRSQIDKDRYRDSYWKNVVLAGCPEPPKKPTDEVIRKIMTALHHIAITGQKTVRVTSDEVEKYFGDNGEED
jgi:hypothetical protein